MLDDWLPKLQDQLSHTQQQQSNSTQQALDMWGAAMNPDQSQAAQAQAAQATADLFAALAGSADQADFASIGLQNLLQTMATVEEENRKRAQQIYNQANQPQTSQPQKKDKQQAAPRPQIVEEPDVSLKEPKFEAPAQQTPPTPSPQERIPNHQYDSPHQGSQYNSPLPKEELDFPKKNAPRIEPPPGAQAAPPAAFAAQKLKQQPFNQNLAADLQKYIDPTQQYSPAGHDGGFPPGEVAPTAPPRQPSKFQQDVMSPFDNQAAGQKTPFYENPHSAPPMQNPPSVPIQNPPSVPMQNPPSVPMQNSPSVPMNNPPSVPMSENLTPQHTPHHTTPQHGVTYPNTTPQHMQSPAPAAACIAERQPAEQPVGIEKFDFREELPAEKVNPHWREEQSRTPTEKGAVATANWQANSQFEVISSDNSKEGSAAATPKDATTMYEKELPSKYLKGRGFSHSGSMNQDSNDHLSSQDSNSMHTLMPATQQNNATSFRYHTETSKDSADEKRFGSQPTAASQESTSNNRWTAQRKSARGRYGGIKIKYTPAGRSKAPSVGASTTPSGYQGRNAANQMYGASHHQSASRKGDPYDWNEEEEANVSPMKKKGSGPQAPQQTLSFSQFSQTQSSVPSCGIAGYGMQQPGYPVYSQDPQLAQYQQPYNPQDPSAFNGSATSSYGQPVGGLDQAAQDEWKMRMVSETKIVLKKFSLPSGGKPMSYKHPRKRHL